METKVLNEKEKEFLNRGKKCKLNELDPIHPIKDQAGKYALLKVNFIIQYKLHKHHLANSLRNNFLAL